MSIKNDELQNGDDFIEADYDEVDESYEEEEYEEDAVNPDDEQGSDSEPDSDTRHEAKDGERANAKVEERIGELTRKRREAERLAEQREKELQELQRKILDSQEPVVPDLPDPDSVSEAEFYDAVRKRDQILQQKMAWQQQKAQFDQQQTYQNQQVAQQRQQDLAQKVKRYNDNAKRLNIKQEDLQRAAMVVNQVGISEEVAEHILSDENGAAITNYLGNNIADLMEVANSNPIRAALYIEQRVKPKLNLKRKTRTKRPPQRAKGGTPNKSERYPLTSGRVKFE